MYMASAAQAGASWLPGATTTKPMNMKVRTREAATCTQGGGDRGNGDRGDTGRREGWMN